MTNTDSDSIYDKICGIIMGNLQGMLYEHHMNSPSLQIQEKQNIVWLGVDDFYPKIAPLGSVTDDTEMAMTLLCYKRQKTRERQTNKELSIMGKWSSMSFYEKKHKNSVQTSQNSKWI